MGFSKKAIFVLLGVLLLGSGLVMAIDRTTGVTATDYQRWNVTPDSGDVTEGGNITNADLTASTLTDKWAGYFGNVTGMLILRKNSDGWDLYNWTYAPGAGGEVCASTNTAFSFTGAQAATQANINTAWSFDSTDADDAVDTFNDGTCYDLVFAQGTVQNAIKATHMGYSDYETCGITDSDGGTNKNDFAFCTNMSQGKNYLNVSVGYELIVPTQEGTGTETYYFYVELA